MFTKFFSLAVLVAATTASPTSLISRQDTTYYLKPQAKAAGTVVDDAVLNAANGGLFIGTETQTSCPSDDSSCGAFTNITGIIVSNSKAEMDVAVPGGQIAYIAETGEFSFTTPDDPNPPPTSTQTGFTRVERFAPTETYAILSYKNSNWLACPVDGSEGVYQVSVASAAKTGCIGFEMAAIEVGSSEPQAYQYD